MTRSPRVSSVASSAGFHPFARVSGGAQLGPDVRLSHTHTHKVEVRSSRGGGRRSQRVEAAYTDTRGKSPVRDEATRRSADVVRVSRASVRASVSSMSAATASAADMSGRINLTNKDDSHVQRNSGYLQAQCKPIPLPALGTQRIIQGNGTNVGTVIALQCPAKHKLVGKDLTCVMDINSTHWVGETYCKPLYPHGDYGFRLAVLASIISSVIILLMSMAFLTCCLVDCIKKDKRKRRERELEAWSLDEQTQQHSRSHYSHKGRNNNNNNNGQEKGISPWDTGNPALCDSMQPCRCHQQCVYSTPTCTYGPPPPLAALPGHGYDQPLLQRNPDPCPPLYPGPPTSELVWQYGQQHRDWSDVNPTTTDGFSMRNMNSNQIVNPKDHSIRIISV